MSNAFESTTLRILVTGIFIGMIALAERSSPEEKHPAASESADTVFQLATASLKEHRYQEAEDGFRKLAQLEPENSRGVVGLVAVWNAQKRYNAAMELLQSELRKNPSRWEFHMLIADTAVLAKKYDLAIDEYLALMNRTDRFSRSAGELSVRIGHAYFLKGELDFALIFLRQAKELLPGNAAAVNALGTALMQAKQTAAAVREYQAALDLEPNNVVALNNLSFLLADGDRDLDTALRYAQRARELQPDSADIADTLGWVYLKSNRTDEALPILRDAVKKDPTRPVFHYHLAVALDHKGDSKAATEELTLALGNTPSKDEEQRIKDLLQKLGR